MYLTVKYKYTELSTIKLNNELNKLFGTVFSWEYKDDYLIFKGQVPFGKFEKNKLKIPSENILAVGGTFSLLEAVCFGIRSFYNEITEAK